MFYQNEIWYRDRPESEVRLQGILRKTPVRDGFSREGRAHLYYLELQDSSHRYPIYTGCSINADLEGSIDKAVVLRGKVVELTIDRTRKEIWPALME